MGLFELVFIGIGLSMDAFAVAICKGLAMKKINIRQCLLIAVFFGGFQALMPMVGWLLGHQFQIYITKIDHWIAFGLLVFLGVKMLLDARKEEEEDDIAKKESLDIKELFMMAIATSIDALAAGITFAFLNVHIVPAVTFIGITTFVLSAIGVKVGNLFGAKSRSYAEFGGGVVLILLGVKILLEHLGFLAF